MQSSIRVQLARDLHDSLAQDLVALSYKLDLLISDYPPQYRAPLREIREALSESTKRVRRELFALREQERDYQENLEKQAKPLQLEVSGELGEIGKFERRIIDELVKNAAVHSKGHHIKIEVNKSRIVVSDDGLGLFGVGELVEQLNGEMKITSGKTGTNVEIDLP